ncbi:uncharacterized protein N7506_003878 [Penicillium brevicompactum]|uniref:Winged helix-turn-helix transcription repressor DNA-binding n=1 Tax=Penicillium camemberti (strain FM 013) TaxID=1429867 RepID=A0A0G4PWQ5_PENC3|nr:uncharacterized protein N7506_003878 [Penicillium brevicompactum]KAJ5344054.1 hypothetical protein N7506_003878 [Penicillium brevicompactum]CRL30902.1 Winged helix-turn-helix transcription repressor DNA-binding [Penicillium camemberti]
MTTPSNEESGDGRCQTIDNIVNNFISEHHDKSLRPLRLANISISEFSTELSNHLSVLNEGGSIALGRGEELTSKSLSLSLQSLFSITTPPVKEGPPLTWTRLVLFAGPQFEGPAEFEIGNSSVELSETDLKLLRSGRPWRFLFPWPDKDDCKKELQSNNTVLQELIDAQKTIGEVLEQISLVRRHLRNHRDLISRLSEDKHHANPRGEALPLDDASFSFSNGGSFDPVASAEYESSGYRYSPYTPTAIGYASNDRSSQPVDQDLNDPALSEGAFAGNSTQLDGSGPEKDARPGFRLHTSDFIQCLSEILDDPKNGDVMRWSENGQSVYVAPESKLPAHILTKMSTKSHQSLVRRLYYFGFHKTGGVFHHESFSRGQPSSIRPTRELSHSPSLPTPLRNSASQRGPRYKTIKRKRARESV